MAVILITGTSSGIGLATALHFARQGNRVFASLRYPARATKLERAINTQKLPITLITLDVDDDASVQCGVDAVLASAGSIDVLVNNAGIGGGTSIEETPIEVAKQLFETHYFGTVRMIRSILPGMRERRSGTIVNISSTAGRVAAAALGHYAAAKHAVEALSEILAQEVRAYNIRVALIEPGVIPTPIFAKHRHPSDPGSPYADHHRRLLRFFKKQLQRPTTPHVVAEMIEHAVTTDTPRLRYLVGSDARAIISGRQCVSDEEWVEDGRLMSDDEYYERMRKRYGSDLYR